MADFEILRERLTIVQRGQHYSGMKTAQYHIKRLDNNRNKPRKMEIVCEGHIPLKATIKNQFP